MLINWLAKKLNPSAVLLCVLQLQSWGRLCSQLTCLQAAPAPARTASAGTPGNPLLGRGLFQHLLELYLHSPGGQPLRYAAAVDSSSLGEKAPA
jgi:hypothetical protein